MDQATWNLLFGWMNGQCMLPEGCSPPTDGVIFYGILLFAGFMFLYWLLTSHDFSDLAVWK